MKRMIGLFFLLALIVGCSNPLQETTGPREIPVAVTAEDIFTTSMIGGVAWAVPEGMDIQQYPIIQRATKGRKLTAAEANRMGLHQRIAPAGTVLWNEDPRAKAFWLDTLDKDRMVWVNEADEIVYIVDCGNRAMEPKKKQSCPSDVTCPGPHLASSPGSNPGTGNVATNGGSGFLGITPARSEGGFLNGLWNMMKDLFWLLLSLLLIILMVAIALWILREVVRWLQGSGGRHYPVPAPLPMPAPRPSRLRRPMGPRPATPVAAPVATPLPESSFQRFGPYDHVALDNDGEAGFRVTGFNGDQEIPLGSYRWAETENAGTSGEYVWVMT